MKLPKKKLVIDNWPDMKLFFNEDRKTIIDICSLRPSSIKELAIEMDLNPGSIHNHTSKLFEAGYLEISETREINGIIEKKYIRSADFFSFAELVGEENTARNKYISKDIGKESFSLLEEDKETIARMTKVTLNKSKYLEARKKLESLINYLKENNDSGDLKVNLISCLGEMGEKK